MYPADIDRGGHFSKEFEKNGKKEQIIRCSA